MRCKRNKSLEIFLFFDSNNMTCSFLDFEPKVKENDSQSDCPHQQATLNDATSKFMKKFDLFYVSNKFRLEPVQSIYLTASWLPAVKLD